MDRIEHAGDMGEGQVLAEMHGDEEAIFRVQIVDNLVQSRLYLLPVAYLLLSDQDHVLGILIPSQVDQGLLIHHQTPGTNGQFLEEFGQFPLPFKDVVVGVHDLHGLIEAVAIAVDQRLQADGHLAQAFGLGGGTPFSTEFVAVILKRALDHHAEVSLQAGITAKLAENSIILIDQLDVNFCRKILGLFTSEPMSTANEVDQFLDKCQVIGIKRTCIQCVGISADASMPRTSPHRRV